VVGGNIASAHKGKRSKEGRRTEKWNQKERKAAVLQMESRRKREATSQVEANIDEKWKGKARAGARIDKAKNMGL
jgi:hypothetical protein